MKNRTFFAAIQLLRPHHWVKNLLIFSPLIFARATNEENLTHAAWAFLAFSLSTSAVYTLNDWRDQDKDRSHPTKRFRPLAAKMIPPQLAFTLGIACLAATGFIQWLTLPMETGWVILIYLLLNLGYSLGLKQIIILDVLLLSLGFVMRVVVGGAATNIELSPWIVLCTFFAALLLSFGKRKGEIELLSSNRTTSEAGLRPKYSRNLLDQLLTLCASCTILCYTLYTIAPETKQQFHTEYLYATVPWVVLGIFYYLGEAQSQRGGDPTQLFWRDPVLPLIIIFWLVTFLGIVEIG